MIINNKTYYLINRSPSQKLCVRINVVYKTSGEIFYLRQLLINYPTYSFKNLLTVDSITYSTFQSATFARGLNHCDKQNAIDTYSEALLDHTPTQMLNLFLQMTLQGYPTAVIYNDPILRSHMIQRNWCLGTNPNLLNDKHGISKLLETLAIKLKMYNKELSDYGLPNYSVEKTELEYAKNEYNMNDEYENYQKLISKFPLTNEMQALLNNIVNSLERKETAIYYLQGSAGTGKTTFCKILAHYVRSKGVHKKY
jgi:hypothetical protein